WPQSMTPVASGSCREMVILASFVLGRPAAAIAGGGACLGRGRVRKDTFSSSGLGPRFGSAAPDCVSVPRGTLRYQGVVGNRRRQRNDSPLVRNASQNHLQIQWLARENGAAYWPPMPPARAPFATRQIGRAHV